MLRFFSRFMKLGSSPSPKCSQEKSLRRQNDESDDSASERHNNQGSWRQAIFNRVIQTGALIEEGEGKMDSDDVASVYLRTFEFHVIDIFNTPKA